MTNAVRRIETTNPCVLAFEISGELSSEDMNSIGSAMNEAFDIYEKVSLLLVFSEFEGAKISSVFDTEALKAQLRSILKIEKYGVVGAPEAVQSLLDTMGLVMPVESRTFDRQAIEKAWEFVEARPASA